MEKCKAVDITYNKQVGTSGQLHRFETSERTIIPTILPTSNIKALDVTDLSEAEVSLFEQQMKEYTKYHDAVVDTIFSFEDWLEQVYGPGADNTVKWRTFNTSGVTER